MSEIKLFRINNDKAIEIPSTAGGLEKSLQTVIEKNLDTMLGIRFLRSEHSTGKVHGGRIDTLGIDENNCPVIIEYKRAINENVINQGLFYLDWLLDHKADFKLLVMETIDPSVANEIDWTGPRLICIAADFSKYDEHAVKQINRNIDLVRYRRFEDGLLALELAHRNQSESIPSEQVVIDPKHTKKSTDKPVIQWLKELDTPMRDLYESLRALLLALGDDVDEKQLKLYIAFRRIKNFACIVFQKKSLMVYVKLNPDTVRLEDHFTRDVRQIGHWATGDLEITITDKESLAKAQPLLVRAYEES
jgi:predicted transport protein